MDKANTIIIFSVLTCENNFFKFNCLIHLLLNNIIVFCVAIYLDILKLV